ncbi:hypothetical protein ACFVMC_32825 [Nocardia sp. NPDC127579]|uniref:hypothetical protein n=1 Tax=Nocardia sp. NPDC127579 TaxID=3345402 RepID=UPI00363CCD4C
MTAVDEYPWGMAPAHLKTRRQLREMGKSPGRSLTARMVGKLRGRQVIARLFDPSLAPEKRTPSPAQLAAIGKATREHQLRAAERRGISRTEMSAPVEPAPAWEQNRPTRLEGNNMSDPTTLAETPTAAEQLGFGHPIGTGQRMAYLLATVAVNQARWNDARLLRALDEAHAAGPEAVAEVTARAEQTQARAEARLQAAPANDPTAAATVGALADALLWHPSSAIAATHLDRLTRSYAARWGVIVDAENLTASLDPAFDAVGAQDRADADRMAARESAAMGIIAALALPDQAKAAVTEAISAWRGTTEAAADPRGHLADEARRREQLSIDLAAARLSENDQARVEFVVDYLGRADVSQVDLLASPAFVDPGMEVRPRIPQLLTSFAANPRAGAIVREEIAVMSTEDQDRVRKAGSEIAAGRDVDVQLWPDHVDRYVLTEALQLYADEVAALRADADFLAEGGIDPQERGKLGAVVSYGGAMTVSDDINTRITHLAQEREQLRTTIENGAGLAGMERAHLGAVLADVDHGRIADAKALPELLFADERSKAAADDTRAGAKASQLSKATREAITQRIEDGAVTVDPSNREGSNVQFAIDMMGNSIYSVASGARASGVQQEREVFTDRRARLGKALALAGIEPGVRGQIRDLIDERARQAGELGKVASQRARHWEAKVAQVAAACNDVRAQRQAAAAGRASHAGRASSPRSERGTGAEADAHARAQAQASRPVHRQQRGEGVER